MPEKLDWKLISALSSTGLAMGLLTSVVGLSMRTESFVWVGCYMLWVLFVERRGCERPFVHIVMASTLTGLIASAVQLTLLSSYLAHNPDYADRLEGMSRAEVAPGFVTQGLLAALVMGVAVGAVAALRRRRRAG